jgi:hypothetical protein
MVVAASPYVNGLIRRVRSSQQTLHTSRARRGSYLSTHPRVSCIKITCSLVLMPRGTLIEAVAGLVQQVSGSR